MSRVKCRHRRPSSFEKFLKPTQIVNEIYNMLNVKDKKYFPTDINIDDAHRIIRDEKEVDRLFTLYRNIDSFYKKDKSYYNDEIFYMTEAIKYNRSCLKIMQNLIIERKLYEDSDNFTNKEVKALRRYIKVIKMMQYIDDQTRKRLRNLKNLKKKSNKAIQSD